MDRWGDRAGIADPTARCGRTATGGRAHGTQTRADAGTPRAQTQEGRVVPVYATTYQMAAYLKQVPLTSETEALFTDLLTRASATVDEVLQGVDPALLVPVPPSVE